MNIEAVRNYCQKLRTFAYGATPAPADSLAIDVACIGELLCDALAASIGPADGCPTPVDDGEIVARELFGIDLPELTPEERLHCDSMPADLVGQLWKELDLEDFVPGTFQHENASKLEKRLIDALKFIHTLPAGKEQTDLEVVVHEAARKLQHLRGLAGLRLGEAIRMETERNVAQARLAAAEAERDGLRRDCNYFQAYYFAIRNRHNGYDPSAREAMPTLKEPETPELALDELMQEAEEITKAESDETIRALTADRDRLKVLVQDACDTEDAIRREAAKVLPADWIKGDTHFVPPVEDVVERLVAQLAAKGAECEGLRRACKDLADDHEFGAIGLVRQDHLKAAREALAVTAPLPPAAADQKPEGKVSGGVAPPIPSCPSCRTPYESPAVCPHCAHDKRKPGAQCTPVIEIAAEPAPPLDLSGVRTGDRGETREYGFAICTSASVRFGQGSIPSRPAISWDTGTRTFHTFHDGRAICGDRALDIIRLLPKPAPAVEAGPVTFDARTAKPGSRWVTRYGGIVTFQHFIPDGWNGRGPEWEAEFSDSYRDVHGVFRSASGARAQHHDIIGPAPAQTGEAGT